MTSHELLLMAVPAAVALAGGVLAALWHPSHQARSFIQHFAAGVVLAALAVELLPDVEREHAPGLVLAGAFALGALAMFALKLVTERMETHPGARTGVDTGLMLATFIDVAVDGFIIGAGFAAGLALTSASPGGWRIVALSGALGLTVAGAAVVGKLVLAGASHAVIGGALAASAAALLYLVTEELLMEAHAGEEKGEPGLDARPLRGVPRVLGGAARGARVASAWTLRRGGDEVRAWPSSSSSRPRRCRPNDHEYPSHRRHDRSG
jgi:ZIP family zinc transporter